MGSASIYYSVSVGAFDVVLVNLGSLLNVSAVLVLIAIYLIPTYFIYEKENTSRKLELALANSLKETRLRKKYENKLKRKREKQRHSEGKN